MNFINLYSFHFISGLFNGGVENETKVDSESRKLYVF